MRLLRRRRPEHETAAERARYEELMTDAQFALEAGDFEHAEALIARATGYATEAAWVDSPVGEPANDATPAV